MAITIKRVSQADLPKTAHKGRTRKPTDFDEYMVVYKPEDHTDADGNVEWDGWLEVPADSDKHLDKLNAELTKASNYFNVGIERRQDTLGLKLWFRVKPRAFKPRNKVDESEATVSELPTGDQSTDQDTPKRSRKAS
jgi:hypothetical protein